MFYHVGLTQAAGDMTQPIVIQRFRAAAIGLGIALGACAWAAFLMKLAQLRAGAPRVPFLEWTMLFCPTLIVFGLVAALRSLYRGIRAYSGRSFLINGILMLLLGGFPWIYTPYLTGGRPGNESAGMIGTLLFVLLGLPSLPVLIFGLHFHGWESDAG